MRPLDPRLLRHARASRRYVALTAVLGFATAVAVVGQALVLAHVIGAGFARAARPGDLVAPLCALAGIVLVRALLGGTQERFAHRASVRVIAELRAAALVRFSRDGMDHDPAAAATLLTRGLDGLDGYLTRYLPQLLLAATVTPSVLAVIAWLDPWSGLAVVVTLPLIPVFMALIGWTTAALSARRLHTMQRLGAQVLDLVAGLPTLRALGRARAQAAQVRDTGESYRRATLATLRLAFTSALVLEGLATLSVALVAVGIGLRLVFGQLDLTTGLAVLILAPEVYLPLRLVGLHYHAAADGVAAAGQVLDILERPGPSVGSRPAPDLHTATVVLQGISVDRRERRAPHDLDLTLHPGEVVALTGANGSGKSTAVEVVLGLRAPDTGQVLVRTEGVEGTDHDEITLAELDLASWHRQIAWVPQRPVVVPATIEQNLWLDAPTSRGASPREAAAALTGLDDVVAALPDGWQTRIGHGGHGLSAGQRQLLGLTRAVLHRDAALVILDEPTAHLDAAAEQVVHRLIESWRARGVTVLLVAHRPALAALADRTVEVTAAMPTPTAGPTSSPASTPASSPTATDPNRESVAVTA